MAVAEKALLDAQRAFPMTQVLFAGVVERRLPAAVSVGWHGNDVEPRQGAIVVVRVGAGLDDLIGRRVRLAAGRRAIYGFVLGARTVPVDISVSRRAMLSLGRLSQESIGCIVEVVI